MLGNHSNPNRLVFRNTGGVSICFLVFLIMPASFAKDSSKAAEKTQIPKIMAMNGAVQDSTQLHEASTKECFEPRRGFCGSIESGFGLLPKTATDYHSAMYFDIRLGYSPISTISVGGSFSESVKLLLEPGVEDSLFAYGNEIAIRLGLAVVWFPYGSTHDKLKNLGILAVGGKQLYLRATALPIPYEPGILSTLPTFEKYESVLRYEAYYVQIGYLLTLQLSNSFGVGLENSFHLAADPDIPHMVTFTFGFRWF